MILAVERVDLGVFWLNHRRIGSARYYSRMMLALLIYFYAFWISCSRRIERRTHGDIRVLFVGADRHPVHVSTAANLDLDVVRGSLAETVTWLPAQENRGEGLFLSLMSENVAQWLARPGVQARGLVVYVGWKAWVRGQNRSKDDFSG